MSQPPYPPQGGNEPGGDQPGSSGWNPADGADDPTRQFDAPAGGDVDFSQSYGSSGEQTRAVKAGLDADVIALSLAPDMDELVRAGLVAKGRPRSSR